MDGVGGEEGGGLFRSGGVRGGRTWTDQQGRGASGRGAGDGWGGGGPDASTLTRLQLHADKDAAAPSVTWIP